MPHYDSEKTCLNFSPLISGDFNSQRTKENIYEYSCSETES